MNNFLTIKETPKGDKLFYYHFPSIYSLTQYIKSHKTNEDVFTNYPLSLKNDPYSIEFFGEPLEDAINHMLSGYNADYREYKELANINTIKYETIPSTSRARTVRSYVGSRVDIDAFASGSPKNMRRLVRDGERKKINVYFSLSYKASDDIQSVINRGIIAIQLMKLFEERGYDINLKAFSLDSVEVGNKREYMFVEVRLKDFEVPLNESKCVGPFIRKEFLRRIIFRLLEVSDVSPNWRSDYGNPVDDDEIREFLNLKEGDILFGSPRNLGIKGISIVDDINSTLSSLGLNEDIKVTKRLKI